MTGDFRVGLEPLDVEVADVELEVLGELPPWLSGVLVRNGPGRWTAQAGGRGEHARHWFDGFALLNRFRFSDGRVHYANRYLRSPAFGEASTTGRYAYAEVGVVPTSWSARLKAFGRPPRTGTNACVNLLWLDGRPVAVTETPDAVAFDPFSLETREQITYADDLPGDTISAHPHHDRDRGALVNLAVEYGRHSSYHLTELPDGSLTRRAVASIPTDLAAYMHTFAMTPRFVVLVEYPLVADPLRLLAGRPIVDSYRWRPERGTRFTVIERATGAVVSRARTEAFFCFHQVNAFEDGDAVLVDLPAMPGEQSWFQFLLAELRGTGARTPAGELRRYRVPLDGGPPTYHLLSPTALEFPRIAYERVSGRPYRWVYGTGTAKTRTTGFADRLVKIDVENGRTNTWSEPGCWPGEPVPVAPTTTATEVDPSRAEDAGVVVSLVLDARARRSFLLVLDASSWIEVARAWLPHAVPLGFHGQWFGEELLTPTTWPTGQ